MWLSWCCCLLVKSDLVVVCLSGLKWFVIFGCYEDLEFFFCYGFFVCFVCCLWWYVICEGDG